MELQLNIDNRITIDFIDLTNDGSIFLDDTELEILNEQLETTVLNRLVNWCAFFDENRSKCIGLYQQTMFALIEAAKTNQLFRTQTKYEFKLSLMFYAQLIASRRFIQINNLVEAKELLNVSLIYGIYPGMVIRSCKKAFEELTIKLEGFRGLFRVLFVRYEMPIILNLIDKINDLSANEIEAMMFIIQGNSIRNFDKLPFPISKREAHYFNNYVPKHLFKENILARAILFSKLLIVSPNSQKYLSDFISGCRTFKHSIDIFYKDLAYWKHAFQIVCEVKSKQIIPAYSYSQIRILEYVDFFEYKKYVEDESYTLKGKTAKSITQALADWHDSADFPETKALLELSWGNDSKKETIIQFKQINYLIKELTKGIELFKESKALKHCVFSYVENCYKGRTSVWSMQRELKGEYKSFITIEVEKNKIIQLSGKRNRSLNIDELSIVALWAEKMKFEFKMYNFH